MITQSQSIEFKLIAAVESERFEELPELLAEYSAHVAGMDVPAEKQVNDLMEWINIHLFDSIDAVRTGLLLNVLNPFKNFLHAVPWITVVAAGALLGYQLAGWRLALVAGAMLLFPVIEVQ